MIILKLNVLLCTLLVIDSLKSITARNINVKREDDLNSVLASPQKQTNGIFRPDIKKDLSKVLEVSKRGRILDATQSESINSLVLSTTPSNSNISDSTQSAPKANEETKPNNNLTSSTLASNSSLTGITQSALKASEETKSHNDLNSSTTPSNSILSDSTQSTPKVNEETKSHNNLTSSTTPSDSNLSGNATVNGISAESSSSTLSTSTTTTSSTTTSSTTTSSTTTSTTTTTTESTTTSKARFNSQKENDFIGFDQPTTKLDYFKNKNPKPNSYQPVNQINYFEEEKNSSWGFVTYFLIFSATCVIGYLIYHNKYKIMALIIEGKRPTSTPQRRFNSNTYTRLENVQDAMPNLN